MVMIQVLTFKNIEKALPSKGAARVMYGYSKHRSCHPLVSWGRLLEGKSRGKKAEGGEGQSRGLGYNGARKGLRANCLSPSSPLI